MWLYPLPALVAFAGWIYHLLLGRFRAHCVRHVDARSRRRRLPRSSAHPCGVAICAQSRGNARRSRFSRCSFRARPAAAAWGSSAIVERDGFPVFTVEGKPFFVYGAAFFYERLPRDRWKPSMLRLARARHQHARPLRALELARALRRRLRFRRAHEPAARFARSAASRANFQFSYRAPAGAGHPQRMAQRRLPGVAPAASGIRHAAARSARRPLSADGDPAERSLRRRSGAVARQRDPPVLRATLARARASRIRPGLESRDRRRARRRSRCLPRQRHVARSALARLPAVARGRRSRRYRPARAGLHQHLSDEGDRILAGLGDGELVPERRVSAWRTRPRPARVFDRPPPNARRINP